MHQPHCGLPPGRDLLRISPRGLSTGGSWRYGGTQTQYTQLPSRFGYRKLRQVRELDAGSCPTKDNTLSYGLTGKVSILWIETVLTRLCILVCHIDTIDACSIRPESTITYNSLAPNIRAFYYCLVDVY